MVTEGGGATRSKTMRTRMCLVLEAVKDSQMNGEVGFVVDEAQVPAVIAPGIMQNIDTASVNNCTTVELDSTKGMQRLADI